MYQEQVIKFGPANALIGIVTIPTEQIKPFADMAVILLNAGVVHRVGQNRIYVKIARKLAERGLTCLRFDYSGIGDSAVAESQDSHEQRRIKETCSALDYLQEIFNINRFTLMGSCSGAVNSVRAGQEDVRVNSVILINPSCTDTMRFFLRYHCMNKWTWKKIFKANLHVKKIFTSLFRKQRINKKVAQINEAIQQPVDEPIGILTTADFNMLITREIKTLVLCAQWDPSLDYCHKILKMLHSDKLKTVVQTKVIPGCDHGLYSLVSQQLIIDTIEQWLVKISQSTISNNVTTHAPHRQLSFLKNI